MKPNCTYSIEAKECPLGMVDCIPESKTVSIPWKTCPNQRYCSSVTQAWELPYYRLQDYFSETENASFLKVNLNYIYPHNYDNCGWKKLMKEYGYANAVDLQYIRFSNRLDVNWNIPKYGFAIAVPLTFQYWDKIVPDHLNQYVETDSKHLKKYYLGNLKTHKFFQDSAGLWWYGDGRSLKSVLKK